MKKTQLISNLKRGSYTSRGYRPRGSFLVESTISLFLLVAIAVVLVSSSMSILRPRTWTMKQNLVDAYLSQEVALANRVDFNTLSSSGSGWKWWDDQAGNTSVLGGTASYTTQKESVVVVGQLPSFTVGGTGRDYEVKEVIRVKKPHQVVSTPATFTPTGASGDMTLLNLGIQCYELQTHVVYTLGGNDYVKSRTVIRSQ